MTSVQYTIRKVPAAVDKVIRKRAQQTGKSFNQTVVDMLALQTFGTTDVPKDTDFDWLFGANTLDDSFDKAIKDLSKADKKLWR